MVAKITVHTVVVPGQSFSRPIFWYVGDKYGYNNPISADPRGFQFEVEADGAELEYIKQNFTGIPFANHKDTVIWRGEFARFIIEHLADLTGDQLGASIEP